MAARASVALPKVIFELMVSIALSPMHLAQVKRVSMHASVTAKEKTGQNSSPLTTCFVRV